MLFNAIAIAAAAALCTVLVITDAKFVLTNSLVTVEEYPHVCVQKDMQCAKITSKNLLQVARVMREARCPQAWIFTAEGQSSADFDLTVKMVPSMQYSDWAGKYGRQLRVSPDPSVFRDAKEDDVLPVVAVKTRKRASQQKPKEDIPYVYYGLCQTKDDDGDEGNSKSGSSRTKSSKRSKGRRKRSDSESSSGDKQKDDNESSDH